MNVKKTAIVMMDLAKVQEELKTWQECIAALFDGRQTRLAASCVWTQEGSHLLADSDREKVLLGG